MTNHDQLTSKKIVALAGGVGGAKLAYGLYHLVSPANLTIIVNTGDDFEHLGLHISPDVDTMMYTLAGLANPKTGWGVREETWHLMTALQRYGGPTWFQLGDQDMATHLLRTKWLREGKAYHWVTNELCHRLGIRCKILPMSNQAVRTVVQTPAGELAFQEYFVKHRTQPVITGLRFIGADTAQPAPGVVEALQQAEAIIFCPSNPWLSLDPILAVPSLRQLIANQPIPKIGVSPIVSGRAIKGPTAKIMTELGLEVSPLAVAQHLGDLLTGWVIDETDDVWQSHLTKMGLRVLTTAIIMHHEADRCRLAQEVLDFAV